MENQLPQPSPPEQPRPSDGEWMLIILFGNVVLVVLCVSLGGFFLLLLLPVANIIAGLLVLLGGRKRLGLMMVLSVLVLGLIGFGTCALMLSNLSIH
ncbi:hypothetical protein [Hymenobacter weizhouensis]|uniref:hypothetical protein n=1 Tax=Hymenobacter sp. YIM 151500-1 TaxID=2987689 RepID=UPI00222765A2|nr:hypothetical protein [Hymenobacter sp. YIM 151500-1]UYZ63785.1 hypothetical protein OIS53_02830 [Hymenobacter sp. YIM 151500-1]